MRYTIPVGTSVIRWAKDNDRLAYNGWGVETKKLVTYNETELVPFWRHIAFCEVYGWEPDGFLTFNLPDTVRPWRFVTVSKRKVKT